MYRPKVLPGLFSGLIAQRPETENTGGVWLPPCCRPSTQGAPTTHTFVRQPGRWQPRQSPSTLSHFSSATHRAGQVCHWCLIHSNTPFPVVWLMVTAYRVVTGSQISADLLLTGCLVYLPFGWMMRLCRSRKCTFPLSLLSMNHTDWHRSCSGSRWGCLYVCLHLWYGGCNRLVKPCYIVWLIHLNCVVGTVAGVCGPGAAAVWSERGSVSVGEGAEWANLFAGPKPRLHWLHQPWQWYSPNWYWRADKCLIMMITGKINIAISQNCLMLCFAFLCVQQGTVSCPTCRSTQFPVQLQSCSSRKLQ